MKTLKYLSLMLMALVLSLGATSCMDKDWDDPTGELSAYGNNSLEERNVISIKEFKEMYDAKQHNSINDTITITDDIMIKGIVTGNDLEGNIYSEVVIDDGTAGMIICVATGGVSGQMALGQEVLINLKGLCYGYYRSQPQIGVPYTSTSSSGVKSTYPSRISRTEWQRRFKCIGKADASKVTAIECTLSELENETRAYELAGRLVKVKGAEFAKADGTTTFAPKSEGKSSGYGVTRYFKGYTSSSKQIGIRTSCYADFAAEKLPQGKQNITGVLTCYKSQARYHATVQFVLRQFSDIEAAQ